MHRWRIDGCLAEVSFASAIDVGTALTFFNTLFETTVQHHIPPESLSRVASIDWVMSGAIQPFGFALAGSAAIAFGLRATLLAAAVWMLISTAAVLAIPDVRNLPAQPLPPAAQGS